MSLRIVHRLMSLSLSRYSPNIDSVRLYSRWMHRSPGKVLLPFESSAKTSLKKEKVVDLDPSVINKNAEKPMTPKNKRLPARTEVKFDSKESVPDDNDLSLTPDKSTSVSTESDFPPEKSKVIKEKRAEKLKKRNFYISQTKVFDDNKEIIYEKLKDNDSRISSLLVKLKSKKERLRSGQILVEGWRLIVDGLEAKCPLKYIIFSSTTDINNLRPFLPKTGVKIYKVPYKEIDRWSDVETSPGIIGVFETPTPQNVKIFSRPLPLTLICDNIRIPGNMGAILRAAVGVGCEKVLLSKGCVDYWEPKVIRSAAGAHFRLPVYYSIDWEEMPKHLAENTSIFIADSNTAIANEQDSTEWDKSTSKFEPLSIPVLPYYSVEYSTLKHITLVIGGETEGISEDSYRLAASRNGVRLNIPLQTGVDSLNTGMAAAVICFEIRKQLKQAWTKIKTERLGQAV